MSWNNLYHKALLLWLLVLSASCSSVLETADDVSGLMRVDLRLDMPDNHIDVRSILPESVIESKITDATIASYGQDGQLVNTLYHEEVAGGVSVYISGTELNNIYVLVNMGDMTSAFPDDEAEVPGITYRLRSYEDVAECGIPMCGVLKGCRYEKGKAISGQLERLFAKLNVRLRHTGLSGASGSNLVAYNLCNKSLYLRQANRRMLPFSTGGSAAATILDIMDISDYNPDLQDWDAYVGTLKPSDVGPGLGYILDTTIVLYIPENIQGILLPGNHDPFEKVGERISDIDGMSYEELCTYIEFNAYKPNRGEGYSGDITYRCYLGEDNVSDFSIRRNSVYDLIMDFTDQGFNLDTWKVVRGDGWTDIRTLCFMDEPYYLYPGTTLNVPLHYNISSSSMPSNSSGSVSGIAYDFDFVELEKSGITCTFMGSEKIIGKNGYSDYYFSLSASSSAKTGTSFPIKVSTSDGIKSDETEVYVAAVGQMVPAWDYCPKYVSQTGQLSFDGVIEGLLPLSVAVSDPSVVGCVPNGSDSFKVTAFRPGKAQLTISNSNGSQSVTVSLDIEAPSMRMSAVSLALAPDGKIDRLYYNYVDENGDPLTNIDQDAYSQYLLPIADCTDYISAVADMSSMNVCIDQLYSSGVLLDVGSCYNISISAADCPEVGSRIIKAYVVDPFVDISTKYHDRLDDYSLFGLSGVNATVRNYFADEIAGQGGLKYNIAPVDADILFVSSSFEPVGSGTFSYANDIYTSDYNWSDDESESGASISVLKNSVTSTSRHGVGRHELKLNVRNRHSGEILSKTVADVDIYVHTAIGANAEFGTLACNKKADTNTIAGIYNAVAGYNFFDTSSSELICYMDVSVKFLTEVSGVRVLEVLQNAAENNLNRLNSLDIVCPNVEDGYVDYSSRLIYSVYGRGDQRMAFCGEPYGMRRGIGPLLYRAMKMTAYPAVPTSSEFMFILLGYNSQQGIAAVAPCYDLHDMNQSDDMAQNTVSKNFPFYFSPVDYNQYLDSSGNGYHVIHALEIIAPKTRGWINLL